MSQTLGECLPPETLLYEYKEFTGEITPDNFFSYQEMRSIVENSTKPDYKKFRKQISCNLNQQFLKFLPKYISSFANLQHLTKTHATMFIGVSDTGEITGIPSQTPIRQKHVQNFLKRALKLVKSNSFNGIHLKDIGIQIHKLEINPQLLNDEITPWIEDWKRKRKDDLKKLHLYKIAFCEWQKVISQYQSRMGLLINSRRYRDELIEFIQKMDPTKTEIIEFLKTNECFVFELGDVANNKDDPDHIFHWTTQQKDKILEEQKNAKPLRPALNLSKYDHIPYGEIIRNLSPLRQKFVENKLSQQLIELSLPINLASEKNPFGQYQWTPVHISDLKFKVRDERKGFPYCREVFDEILSLNGDDLFWFEMDEDNETDTMFTPDVNFE